MGNSNIQIPPDSTGKLVDTFVTLVTSQHREALVIADPASATGVATVTSSGGLQVSQTSNGYLVRSLSSGIVTLSSATSLSSGTVTLSSNPTIISASSGFVQLTSPISLSSGTVTLSSAIGISSGTVGLSSGTVTLSSNPTIISASSGLIQLTSAIGISSGTITLSSNPTVVNASSGLVGLVAWSSPLGAGHGVTGATYVSSSSTNSIVVKSSPGTFYGFYAFNSTQSLRYVHIHNTTSAPVAGTTILTDRLVGDYGIPYSTGGAGAQHIINPFGVYCANGISLLMLSGADSTSTGVIGASDIALTVYYI
jgi:hypothetical protein